ncbi:hypothetical protein T05_533 [Trichinella murrelli]|uniref:Uncharacterized protein n=1 Tax=Trichinella murrelli TaxID=144512 RepID=A0A0V0TAC3_9BILA|nr:hypothetical protein T05_533 [Trichinella murrelli]
MSSVFGSHKTPSKSCLPKLPCRLRVTSERQCFVASHDTGAIAHEPSQIESTLFEQTLRLLHQLLRLFDAVATEDEVVDIHVRCDQSGRFVTRVLTLVLGMRPDGLNSEERRGSQPEAHSFQPMLPWSLSSSTVSPKEPTCVPVFRVKTHL